MNDEKDEGVHHDVIPLSTARLDLANVDYARLAQRVNDTESYKRCEALSAVALSDRLVGRMREKGLTRLVGTPIRYARPRHMYRTTDQQTRTDVQLGPQGSCTLPDFVYLYAINSSLPHSSRAGIPRTVDDCLRDRSLVESVLPERRDLSERPSQSWIGKYLSRLGSIAIHQEGISILAQTFGRPSKVLHP